MGMMQTFIKIYHLILVFLLSLTLLTPIYAESRSWNELVERNKIYYEKFKDTPFNGNIKFYWKSGNLREKGAIKNGKKDGPWEYYYENGKVKEIETYKVGVLNGVREQYGSGGQLFIKSSFSNGKLDGPWVYIDPYDGWVYTRGYYKKGRKHGQWKYFTMFGEVEKSEIWNLGKKIYDSSLSESS